MSASEMHSLERRALDDPLLAEALEGGGSIHPDDFARDVASLRGRFVQPEVEKRWVWPARIAAAVTLLVAASWVAMRFSGSATGDDSRLALKKEEQTQQPKDDNAKKAAPTIPPETTSSGPAENDQQLEEQEQKPSAAEGASVDAPLIASRSEEGQKTQARQFMADSGKRTPDVQALLSEQPAAGIAASGDGLTLAAGEKTESAGRRQVRGRVTSAGKPLAGVAVKGNGGGATTDAQGDFMITVDDTQPDLTLSSAGFKTKEVPVRDRSHVVVEMEPDVTSLSEPIITSRSRIPGEVTPAPNQVKASPSVGTKSYDEYLDTHYRYPQAARGDRVEGRITVEFVVQPDSTLTDFNVVRGIGHGCDEELIRVIKAGPYWTPAKSGNWAVQEKATVRFRVRVPD